MNNFQFPLLIALVGLTCWASTTNNCQGGEKPNIVLFFIDDWAWNGTPVKMVDGMENSRMPVLQMPNVERLVREGMKFTNAYASIFGEIAESS